MSNTASVKTAVESAKSPFEMVVSPLAVQQVKSLLQGQKSGMAVRVFVQLGGGGGCCGGGMGPQFGMAFDKPKNGDEILQVDGVKFVVDPYSSEFLQGAHIDYVQTPEESGFKITNPNLPMSEAGAGGGCGSCGASAENGGSCGCGSGGCC